MHLQKIIAEYNDRRLIWSEFKTVDPDNITKSDSLKLFLMIDECFASKHLEAFVSGGSPIHLNLKARIKQLTFAMIELYSLGFEIPKTAKRCLRRMVHIKMGMAA